MSHPGRATSAPRSWACRHSARSADTSVTWPDASPVTARRVSSPLPAACTTVTSSAVPTPTPPRAAPSRTTTTGPVSRPVPTAARTRSTKVRAAPGRSRHQPSGRDPITFAASMRSTCPVSLSGTSGTADPRHPLNQRFPVRARPRARPGPLGHSPVEANRALGPHHHAGGILSIGSFHSVASVASGLSWWSLTAWRSQRSTAGTGGSCPHGAPAARP